MSDLLAPVLVVMENEVDAFWCFAGFMELVVSLYYATNSLFFHCKFFQFNGVHSDSCAKTKE